MTTPPSAIPVQDGNRCACGHAWINPTLATLHDNGITHSRTHCTGTPQNAQAGGSMTTPPSATYPKDYLITWWIVTTIVLVGCFLIVLALTGSVLAAYIADQGVILGVTMGMHRGQTRIPGNAPQDGAS